LQNIANGRGWIGFTYWNAGTAPVHSNGTAVDASASGPSLDSNLNTPYWGIELRCVQSLCSWPGYATVITPAKIKLTSVTPDRTPWGSPVRISGRVLGGYIPATSKLLRLDLGIVGIPGLSKIQGIPNVAPDGTFTTTYKFGRYQGVVRF
jgi:hypothetical protein